MFIVGNLISALTTIADYILVISSWLVVIRALLSWVNPDPHNPIVRFLYSVTEPMLAPFRRLFPVYGIGIDISPVLALIFIWFLRLFVIRTLFGIAMRLG